ncbi:hypothetical protein [Candidatus Sneabacter namystus]|uniref:Uncharacterized protein n=1 Tax=Candidatus Sneabacter namystus TaxID=2601646 RepID=A0A5C0UJF2_9RICK|nr:hypothetical protein [Candidatus Sneabacter namystus]QEK39907.1 hypothetical protein FZC37_03090 [Candidatus Sneabacter namystus]
MKNTTVLQSQSNGDRVREIFKRLFPRKYKYWINLMETTGIMRLLPKKQTSYAELFIETNKAIQQTWRTTSNVEIRDLSDCFSRKERAQIFEALMAMNLYKEKMPSQKHYDVIILKSATQERVLRRVKYLKSMLKRGITASTVYAIVGNRELDPRHESLAHLLQMNKLPQDELAMVRCVITKHLPWSLCKTIKYIYIPNGDNTKKTSGQTLNQLWLEKFNKTYRKPNTKILVISNQPFVQYHTVSLVKTLTNNFEHIPQINGYISFKIQDDIEIEGAGPDGNSAQLALGLDALAATLDIRIPLFLKRVEKLFGEKSTT